jgi:hypothetical protein
MANSTTQSFIVSGPIVSFDRDIDLTAADAEEEISLLAGDLRRVIERMRKRANALARMSDGSSVSETRTIGRGVTIGTSISEKA